MTEHPNEPAPDDRQPPATPHYDSTELFRGARVVVIEHAGQQYRLMVTRNDRLILQK